MNVLISAFVRTTVDDINSFIPKDIIGLILLFYQHDLSAYEYIAIFLVKTEPYGHLTAFNIDNDIDNKKNNEVNIYCNKSNLCQEELGTTVKLYQLNKFPEHIRQNLFPKYKQINLNQHKNKLHVMFRVEGENKTSQNLCTAYLIETDDIFTLPLSSPPIDRCAMLLSPIFGLITLGGYHFESSTAYNDVQVLTLRDEDDIHMNINPFYWDSNKIQRMNKTRSNQAVYLIQNNMFVCGGWLSSGVGDTNTTEIYSFDTNQWVNVESMNYAHLCHGLVYDDVNSNDMFVVGGTRTYQSKLVEQYSFEKNKWLNLESTNHQHKWFPDVKIKNGTTLICTGNHYNYNQDDDGHSGWGYSEFLDLRDSQHKWQLINDKSIDQMLGCTDKKKFDKKMRGIWSL